MPDTACRIGLTQALNKPPPAPLTSTLRASASTTASPAAPSPSPPLRRRERICEAAALPTKSRRRASQSLSPPPLLSLSSPAEGDALDHVLVSLQRRHAFAAAVCPHPYPSQLYNWYHSGGWTVPTHIRVSHAAGITATPEKRMHESASTVRSAHPSQSLGYESRYSQQVNITLFTTSVWNATLEIALVVNNVILVCVSGVCSGVCTKPSR